MLKYFFFVCIACFSVLSAQDFFNEWDANRDGKVTIDEFPGGRSNMAYFNEIDGNRDGIITYDEFKKYLGLPAETHSDRPQHYGKKNERQRIRELEQEVQQLKARNMQLEQQKNQLEKRLKDILRNPPQHHGNAEVVKLQQEVAKLQQEVKRLQDELNRKQVVTPVNPYQPVQPVKPYQPVPVPVKPYQPVQTDPVEASLEKPSSSPAQDMLMAEEAARLNAIRILATKIRGSWIAGCSSNVDGANKLLIIGKLDPTRLVGVETLPTDPGKDYDFANGIVKVTVQIRRANIIESIRQMNPSMTAEDYQELRFMFPEIIDATSGGSWTPKGQKVILALHGAQLDARRKLVEQLRGVMIKSSTRMENFVVQQHEVVMSIESTLLIGVNILREEVIAGSIAQSTVGISRTMFIYSIRRGLESAGLNLTPDEYQNMRNMLSQTEYSFTGKAAIK